MADLFLTWDEAQGEALPHYCVSCAAPATEWADRQICKTQHHIFSIQYSYVDVTLPVCPQHRNLSWFFLHRVVARKIHEDGVLLSHVSPGFVQAVWDYRDEMESHPAPSPARRLAPGPPSQRMDYEDDDFEESLPRHRTWNARYAPNPVGWTAGKIVLLVFVVLLFAPCSLFLLMALVAGFWRAMM